MDIPAKFATISPRLDTFADKFQLRRHPFLPELDLYSIPRKDAALTKQLQDQGHSWQWCYMWECGAALARWVLDNPHIVKDKLVYDIGTGLGTVAIAAKMAGAKIAVGLDTCVFSEFAVANNSDANGVVVPTYNTTLQNAKIAAHSVILASDLVYGQKASDDILDHLVELSETSTVILALSGRTNPKYEINRYDLYHMTDYQVPCFTEGLELVETMPVSLWTCNSLILKGL